MMGLRVLEAEFKVRMHKALGLDGADDYVEVPNSPNLNPTEAITVVAWVYLKGYNAYKKPQDVARKEGQWAFGFTPDGRISGWVHTNGAWRGTWAGGGDSLFGSRHFVAYRFRDKRYIDFFVDETLIWTYDTGVVAPLDVTTNPVTIGGPNYREFLNGTIALFYIYDIALSEAEIKHIYYNPFDPPRIEHLNVWLAPGSIDLANGKWWDLSGKGNHGIIYGCNEVLLTEPEVVVV